MINSDHRIRGRKVHCDLRHTNSNEQKKNQKRRVFIGGLPTNASDEELTQFFSKFGKVRAAYAIKDLNGARKNYGYVDFFNEHSAQIAVKASPVFIRSKKVDIRPYVKKERTTGPTNRRRKNNNKRERREPSIHSFSSSSTETESDRSSFDQSPSQGQPQFVPPQDLVWSKIDYKLALPDFSNKVLGCFMNNKGEQLQKLTRAFMSAMMNNQQEHAQYYMQRIELLKNQIFDGSYMKGIELGRDRLR